MTSPFSAIDLFLKADAVVQAVLLLLLAASVGTWAVILEKALAIARARRQTAALERRDGRPPLAAAIDAAAAREDQASDPGESRLERRERLERAMRAAMRAELRRLEGGLSFLATVAAAAPFVGLFGTVWGIMNAFEAIGRTQDTSLAAVAPGISEALFATAIGLAAAIPAVIGYNRLAGEVTRLGHRIGTVIAERGRALASGVAAE